MLLTNRLFFEQVGAMLDEGCEVEIRMKGHSMRPLLRNERDKAVLAPCTDPSRLQCGDVVLFRSGNRHILHRIVGTDNRAGTVAATAGNHLTETYAAQDGKRPMKAYAPSTAPPSGKSPVEIPVPTDTQYFTLAGDGNYRLREHCTTTDIVAVLVRVVRPSGRVIDCRSRRWRWQSCCWLALPAIIRRFILLLLWRSGVR